MMLSKTALPLVFCAAMWSTARAADWYTGAPAAEAPPSPAQPQPAVSIDLSVDGTSRSSIAGAFVGKIAPFGSIAESGPRIRVSTVIGKYAYDASDLPVYVPVGAAFIPRNSGYGRVHGTLEDGSFMVGYEVVSNQGGVALYVGPDVMNHSLSPFDPGNQVRGVSVGAKIGVEAFARPTDSTMLALIAYYSTVHNSYYTRLKFGVELADYVYVGPEALALGDDYFSQWRAGAHVTGLKLGAVQIGVSSGYLRDRVRGGGAYGILDTHISF
ncbi:cellulose biosynthesis protein BcsS [Methylosinus sp. Ce-a6]|uniref:cellulose biosynthesis protein BcsS n=1 Tax=Methylosinus sp. Ce-a6 TaxID=2172005 RepID=UPI0013571E56|nr:cellulose biosynthesis protein BcsS [Methylosinus sp. Ce-a6]